MTTRGTIRTGIGGWVFEPWNEGFYRLKLPKTKHLQHAGSQKPKTLTKWAADVPDGFVFSLKTTARCSQKMPLRSQNH